MALRYSLRKACSILSTTVLCCYSVYWLNCTDWFYEPALTILTSKLLKTSLMISSVIKRERYLLVIFSLRKVGKSVNTYKHQEHKMLNIRLHECWLGEGVQISECTTEEVSDQKIILRERKYMTSIENNHIWSMNFWHNNDAMSPFGS